MYGDVVSSGLFCVRPIALLQQTQKLYFGFIDAQMVK